MTPKIQELMQRLNLLECSKAPKREIKQVRDELLYLEEQERKANCNTSKIIVPKTAQEVSQVDWRCFGPIGPAPTLSKIEEVITELSKTQKQNIQSIPNPEWKDAPFETVSCGPEQQINLGPKPESLTLVSEVKRLEEELKAARKLIWRLIATYCEGDLRIEVPVDVPENWELRIRMEDHKTQCLMCLPSSSIIKIQEENKPKEPTAEKGYYTK